MSYPNGVLAFLVIVLIVNTSFANVFNNFNSHRLLLKLDASKLDWTQVKEKWINQPLDHFNPSERRTLKMRYFENLDLWEPGGPIIIFLGGEEPQDPYWIAQDDTLPYKIAKDTNGALLATEHRYYGISKPRISSNNVAKYYKFLSSQQALADVAYLIKAVKLNPKYKSSKVVVVGGSYSGNLAAWLRGLYPGLVDAAVAASAPVLAKKDFKEYLEVVTYTFRTYGSEECLKRIKRLFKMCEKLLKSSRGIETIKRKFNICPESDLTLIKNQQLFFDNVLYDHLSFIAQYKNPIVVQNECDMLTFDSKLLKRIRPDNSSKHCTNMDFNFTSSSFVHNAWLYQVCSEFGYFQTTSSEIQPFVHWSPLEFNIELYCKHFIKGNRGKRIDEAVARTNLMYGGRRPNVSKVVFTHGDMDPWHVLGVLEDLGPDAPVIIVNGTSHCAILRVDEYEPEELTINRKYVRKLIRKWISTP